MSRSSRRCLLLLEKCKNLRQVKQAQAQIIFAGLGQDSFAVSRLMAFCSDPNHGCLIHAKLLFDYTQNPTLCIWNTMMKAFLLKECHAEAVQLYCKLFHGGLRPDNYTFPYVLKSCANLQSFRAGLQLHGHVVKLGFCSDTFVANTLILMYMTCGDASAAEQVFEGIPQRDAASWTVMISGHSKLGNVEAARGLYNQVVMKDRGIWGAMISGYVQNNCLKEGLAMFRLMQAEGLEPDEGVLVSALSACAQLGAIDIGSWIRWYVDRVKLALSARLGTALMDMYAKCGQMSLATEMFDEMEKRDVVSWNVMILGFAMHGDGEEALAIYHCMQRQGIKPDAATFVAVLTACSHSGLVEQGLQIFNSMRSSYGIEPGSEHYGCTIDCLGRAGRLREALGMVAKEILPSGISAKERSVACRALLSACWRYGEKQLAETAAGHLLDLEVHSSGAYVLLSNIYDGCGDREDAWRVRKSMKDKGVLKVPGCSSILLAGGHIIQEFVTGDQMHPQKEEIYSFLNMINAHFTSLEY